MRTLNKSRLELYVENYLKSHHFRRSVQNLKYLRKVSVWLEQKIELDTCSLNEPVRDYFTLRDNQFTRTVYNMLINMSRNKYRISLQRTKQLIDDFVATCCA